MTTAQILDIQRSPTADIQMITPEIAAGWLANNPRNRSLVRQRVQDYARRILRAEWRLNGEAVKLAVDGSLLDGQHRLAAVVEAGKINPKVSVPMFVVTGLPAETQDTMDQGMKRTTANILQIHGFIDPNVLAATGQLCWGYSSGVLDRKTAADRRASSTQILGFVEDNRESLSGAVIRGRSLRRYLPVTISTAAAAYWIIAPVDSRDAAEFWLKLQTGENLPSGSGPLVLRNRLMREATQPRKPETRQILAAFVKAWNAYRQERPISLLVWKDNEPFPKAT